MRAYQNLEVTGSIGVTGSITANFMTAINFYGTASQAATSSYAATSSFLSGSGALSGSVTGSITGSFKGEMTGSLSGSLIGVATGSFTGSFYGEFSGSGANLYDISASSIVGLDLSSVGSGSVTASTDPNNGFVVTSPDNGSTFTGSINLISGSYSGSGANLSNIPVSAIQGLSLASIGSGSVTASVDPGTGFVVKSTTRGSIFSGSVQVSGSVRATSFTGSLLGTASLANSASYLSGSSAIVQNLTVAGTASIKYLDVVYETASFINITGSTKFGDELVDQHEFTGSVNISGSFGLRGSASFQDLQITGSVGISGSLEVSGGFTVVGTDGSSIKVNVPSDPSTGSLFTIADGASNTIFEVFVNRVTSITGSVQITGSLDVTSGITGSMTGSLRGTVTGSMTGSLIGTVTGSMTGSLRGTLTGSMTGSLRGTVTGAMAGQLSGSFTGSGVGNFSGSFTGSFWGTSSYSYTASQARTSSLSLLSVTASYALTASYVSGSGNADSASYLSGSTAILRNLTVVETASAGLYIGQFSGSFSGVDTTLISSGSASAAIKYDVSGSSSLQINTDTAISGGLYVSLYSGSTAITGTNVFGTASYSIYSTTASVALTASYVTYSATTLTNVKTVRAVGNIAKGQVVRISGANGNNLLVTTASYFSDQYSANVLGVTTTAIADNATGTVVTDGEITGIDLSAFAAGDLLYLGNLGNLTNVAPVAPLHSVRMGVVEKATNNGIAYIRVDNGYELDELHDVAYVSRSIGDLLVVSNSVWYNTKQLTGSYGLTGSLNFFQSASVSGTNIFGTASNAVSASNALTASYVQFQYNRELHVSVAGSDSTGDGTFLFPFRTISKALHSASSAIQIVVHPGTYEESPTVSGSASNITITTANSDLGSITEISGSLTVNSYTAPTRVLGIAINNIIHTGSQNLYLQDVTVRSGVSKTGNGYLEATKIGCQSPANFSVTAPGTVVIQNSLVDGLVVNDASAVVNLISNTAVTAPSCSLGILSIDGGVVYSQHVDSGSVFSGVGAVVSLANVLCLTPTNTSASIKLNAFSGTSIKNVTYNKVDSTLGVSLSNKSHFQHIQADGISGSFSGSFQGTIEGTASYAAQAAFMDGGSF